MQLHFLPLDINKTKYSDNIKVNSEKNENN